MHFKCLAYVYLVFFLNRNSPTLFFYYYYVTLTPREHDVILFTYTSTFENNKKYIKQKINKIKVRCSNMFKKTHTLQYVMS